MIITKIKNTKISISSAFVRIFWCPYQNVMNKKGIFFIFQVRRVRKWCFFFFNSLCKCTWHTANKIKHRFNIAGYILRHIRLGRRGCMNKILTVETVIGCVIIEYTIDKIWAALYPTYTALSIIFFFHIK